MRALGVDAWRADKRAKREAGGCGEFGQEGEEDEVDNEGHVESRRGLRIGEEGLLERGVEQRQAGRDLKDPAAQKLT